MKHARRALAAVAAAGVAGPHRDPCHHHSRAGRSHLALIAQLGQGRGGFYTYDWLENLLGLDMHSADHVVSEWQDIQAGDQIRLAADVGLAVAVAEPGRALVIRGGNPMGPVPCPYDCTWGWVLREAQDGTTRLVVRERYAYTRRWAPFLLEPVQLISFVMTQRMLRGIKERAETSARRRLP